MKLLILALTLISASAFAAPRDVKLTEECEAQIKEQALKMETAYLAAQGEALSEQIELYAGLSYWPKREDVSVSVRITDLKDGRYVSYRAKVLKTEALACNIPIARANATACRYSAEGGPDKLNAIEGLNFRSGRDIKPNTRLTEIEKKQIRAFLGQSGGKNQNIAKLIKGTDDGELSTGTVTLPGDRVLEYYGAYGGDNPFGIFFVKGTAQVAGDNSDGSVCIK